MMEDEGAFLQTHANGKDTPLREVIFERSGDVNIRFNRFVGKGDHIGAYQIPLDQFINLCKEFIEAQGYRVFDQQPDHEHYLVSYDDHQYPSLEAAKKELGTRMEEDARSKLEIFHVETYYDLVYTNESE
jgi:hypothetical protein